jgi:hypothetical protein
VANRTWHVATSILVYLFFVAAFIVLLGRTRNLILDLPWMLAGFFVVITGAEISDYDQLPDWKWLSHRSILTHSALIPFVIFVVEFLLLPPAAFITLAPLLTLAFAGFASHLFLDLFPVWAGIGRKAKDDKTNALMKSSGAAIGRWFAAGITGNDALYKKMEGTYQVHLPLKVKVEEVGKGKRKKPEEKEMKALSKTASRIWYVVNGLLVVLFALLSWNGFIPFLP